ncbi:MAG: ligase-associated DNA damage response endonuclease PdeM [Pseudomonadota bacterium]
MPASPCPNASATLEAHQTARLTIGQLTAILRRSGALWLPGSRSLVVADLHLGKSERIARRQGHLLPPYETAETLDRLTAEIAALDPAEVICLGDSFDDTAAATRLGQGQGQRLAELVRRRQWIWLAGNHDPRPAGHGGQSCAELVRGGTVFRHIARLESERPEVSGHYHPKARIEHRGRRIQRPCFLGDQRRLILPAFGCYTGGLDAQDPVFDPLFPHGARLWLTGRRITQLPRHAS